MTDKKTAPAASEPAPAHHVKARVFALEFHLAQRTILSEIPAEAEKLVRYILGGKPAPSPDVVEARITAIKVAARGMISRSALIEQAKPFEKYILTGQAPAKAKVPAAAGEGPADDPSSTESLVPPEGGEAGDVRPQGGRPSSRPELGRAVEA